MIKSSKQKSNKSKSKEKQITIKAELPIPLGELAFYILKKGENEYRLLDLLYHRPCVVIKVIKKIIYEIITKKKLNIKITELKFDYNDVDDTEHGVSYFNAKIKGTERELKKMVGEDKTFIYDWEEHYKNIQSSELNNKKNPYSLSQLALFSKEIKEAGGFDELMINKQALEQREDCYSIPRYENVEEYKEKYLIGKYKTLRPYYNTRVPYSFWSQLYIALKKKLCPSK